MLRTLPDSRLKCLNQAAQELVLIQRDTQREESTY